MTRRRYTNYDNVSNKKSWQEMRRWSQERRAKKKDLKTQIPQHEVKEVESIKNNRSTPSITWIGHSTFLIQLGGLNIVTDPVWAKRMGFQKRLTEPGIPIQDLPEIDVVLISHGHYDHLDFPSIKKLKGSPVYYVPIGLKSAFRKRGYQHVVEANWWDSFTFQNVQITFVPAQHWTRRGLTDMNTSHWGGWIVEDNTANHSIYFVGDTGYFKGFTEINEKFQIDTVLMPIGAYEPEWFMRDSHINPEDAVKAFLELKGKRFIPMHYGAYRLADDTGPEALQRLYNEWDRRALPEENILILKIGQTLWM